MNALHGAKNKAPKMKVQPAYFHEPWASQPAMKIRLAWLEPRLNAQTQTRKMTPDHAHKTHDQLISWKTGQPGPASSHKTSTPVLFTNPLSFAQRSAGITTAFPQQRRATASQRHSVSQRHTKGGNPVQAQISPERSLRPGLPCSIHLVFQALSYF